MVAIAYAPRYEGSYMPGRGEHSDIQIFSPYKYLFISDSYFFIQIYLEIDLYHFLYQYIFYIHSYFFGMNVL